MNNSIKTIIKYTAIESLQWAESGQNVLIVNPDHFVLNGKIISDVTESLKTEFPIKLPPILLITDIEASYELVSNIIDSINKIGTELLIIENTQGYDSRN